MDTRAADITAHHSKIRIAICYPTDPAGYVPSGIDSFIRGVLKWAPEDCDYTLFGATSDPVVRPVGRETMVLLGERTVRFLPIVRVDAAGKRRLLPLTVKYLWALRKYVRSGRLAEFDILDFHRVEPLCLFVRDPRPKNVLLHTDRAVLREKNADIMWRYAPWLYEYVEKWLFKSVDRVFSVRRDVVERYAKAFPHLAGRVAFIPTSVDTSVFHPARDAQERNELRTKLTRTLSVRSGARLLVFVGRLDRAKDPLLLLQAFAEADKRLGDLHLIVIGDGILRPEVEAAVARMNFSDRVSLLGAKRGADIADVLRASDLFLLTSGYEGMPIAVLEALASGLPVVTTDVGEVRLIVQEGVNGQISKERSPSGLADAICSALGNIQSMSGAPCRDAAARYSPDLVFGRVYENHRLQLKTSPSSAVISGR